MRAVLQRCPPNRVNPTHDLTELVGKPSLIDTNDAYRMATQWLAAIDVDIEAVKKLKGSVNQLRYSPAGTTKMIALPLFYVDFGSKRYPASGNLKASDKPLISVEILGTTKELQDLEIHDLSLSDRPPLLITNIFDLISTPSQTMEPVKGN
jgi:hypothetical protein